MRTKLPGIKILLAFLAAGFIVFANAGHAQAVGGSGTSGTLAPEKYKDVVSGKGDLVCTIKDSSKVHCEMSNYRGQVCSGADGRCNRRDYYYNPEKSAKSGKDVFEADRDGGTSDSTKDKLWGYLVFQLSKARDKGVSGDYSTFAVTQDYTKWADGLTDTIDGDDDNIKKDGPEGICSVVLNQTEAVKCKIGGNNMGKTVSVASQGSYTSGLSGFQNSKGDDCAEGGALGFILCPVDKLLSDASHAIADQIVGMLNVKTSDFQDIKIKDVFNQVLAIANGLFAIIFLVAIFANALSIGVDNYTIKKVLPRLVMAVILAQFSYYISIAVIEAGNVLGHAIPQTLFNTTQTSGFNPDSILGSFAGIIFSILFFLVAFVAFLVGIFVLALRQIILYGLVITGPFAFAAWVLPGTDKAFKFWWSNLLKLSLMYPIMSTLIVGSFYFQDVLRGLGGYPVQLGAAILPIVAMFYLPKTFKWSGQLMSGTAGKISDYGAKKSKGVVKDSAKDGKIAEGINKGADKLMDTPFGKGVTRTPMLGTAVQKNLGSRAKRIESKQNLENLPGSRLEKMSSQGHKGAAEVLKKKYSEELDKQESRAAKGLSVDATKLVNMRTAIGGVEKPGTVENTARATSEANRIANAATNYVNSAPAGTVREMPQITYSKKADGDGVVRDYFAGTRHTKPGVAPPPVAPGAPSLTQPGPAVVFTAPIPGGGVAAVPPPHGGHP